MQSMQVPIMLCFKATQLLQATLTWAYSLIKYLSLSPNLTQNAAQNPMSIL